MSAQQLAALITQYPKLWILTGAGISAASGIPTYRDHGGRWQSAQPIQHQEFIDDPQRRQRYWARSAVGWPLMSHAAPNSNHLCLAQLESLGFVTHLVTQNVDGLHQKAGHRRVTDLHGRLDTVRCLACGHSEPRDSVQQQLLADNPFLVEVNRQPAPDGDAHLAESIVTQVKSPCCPVCQGIVMPDVVFFGGAVPKARVTLAKTHLQHADMLLVVGSSLSVFSGFRFVKYAEALALPIVAINQGKTRGDPYFQQKFSEDSAGLLEETLKLLTH